MLVPVGSNNSAVCRCKNLVNIRGMKDLPTEEYSPEEAGVGGSIPSLATKFSTTYQACQSPTCSTPFQKKSRHNRVCQPNGTEKPPVRNQFRDTPACEP